MSNPRWVAFTRSLEQPFRVEAGQVVPLDADTLRGLQAAQPAGEPCVFDVTPRASALALRDAGLLGEGGRTYAALYPVPCPACGARAQAAFTVCAECHNYRRVWTPNVVRAEALRREHEKFRWALMRDSLEYYGQKGTDRWVEALSREWTASKKEPPVTGAKSGAQP